MDFTSLTAISPIDGRYRNQVSNLAHYFSEFGLIRYRLRVEIEYFIALCELPLPQLSGFDKELYHQLRQIYKSFSLDDAQAIKAIEKITNHDVKAVEYFIKNKFKDLGIIEYQEFIHFALTSQDINNTAIPLLLKESIDLEFHPVLEQLISRLEELANSWADIPMLAFTHGQPASPTRLGKELQVFQYRLTGQTNNFMDIPNSAKFGGANGNFNAHYVAYPDVDWVEFADHFVNEILDLSRSRYTTQIDNYDNLSALFDNMRRINVILIDFCRDMWTYISMGYFRQRINADEVGSSAMPHKVNPIDFENAEGNLGIANAMFSHFSDKLPISRLQRDLTDSTVLRNIGVPVAHTLISLRSILRGLGKLELNQEKIDNDLKENWVVVSEAIQTVLRREGYPKPYEVLKYLTRKNEKITSDSILQFIDELGVSDTVKEELKQITPFNYTGVRNLGG